MDGPKGDRTALPADRRRMNATGVIFWIAFRGSVASRLTAAIVSEESRGVLKESPESPRFREGSVILGSSTVPLGGPLNFGDRIEVDNPQRTSDHYPKDHAQKYDVYLVWIAR